ncbi:HET-domain-containing protein [Mollisia scopiformis]|uniref:HET-domain-containing protein n=1 Tax=Mollisia scopiformis TaxID=149040 RepID=A0A132B2F3_MOLSC|nr:HET-domain-containing protein [Mollisia scopiformis]KUJ06501.1 HET-domain-containing protein [Mollisia scopiformis]
MHIDINEAEDQAPTIYRPLDGERREIRLVTLSPRNFADDIHCTLSRSWLDGQPASYEALSYVWGDDGSRRQIFIENIPSLVTVNLEVALRHLRRHQQPRILWIDAICINQNDIDERNVQVRHMGDVYKYASRVIAWLGEESDDSNLAFDALEHFPRDLEMHWDPSMNASLQAEVFEPKYLDAFQNLFRRPWWHRVWTAQESILGPVLDIICGKRQVSADLLRDVYLGLQKHDGSCCRDFFWNERLDLRFDEAGRLLERLTDYRQKLLEHLLSNFRSRHCSDPRDKVYGMLGLCHADLRKTIIPSYSLPVSLVYEEATLRIIESQGSLHVLSQISPGSWDKVARTTENLPSWVPDWALDMSQKEIQILAVRTSLLDHYYASSGAVAWIRHSDRSSIVLGGIIVGRIGAVSKSTGSNWNEYRSTFLEWRQMAGIDEAPNRPYTSRPPTTYYNAYRQTISGAMMQDRSSLQDPTKKTRVSDNAAFRCWHDAWWNWIQVHDGDFRKIHLASSEYTGTEISLFGAGVYASTGMRRLLITEEEGWLGLAPANARIGDVIALLQGGSVPYILRPKRHAETGTYKFIGDAYVHGIMDGEAWDIDALQDITLV